MGSRPKQRPSLLGLSARTASRSERFEANRRRRLLGRDRAYAATLGQDAPHGRGVKGSIRLAPDQTDRRSRLPRVFSGLRPEARHTPRRPCGLPHGRGVTGRMLFWVPDQNNALRFSGFQPEARLRATLGQDAPHGLGVSDPSPCAPPRQAGKPGPIGHRVVGFCGTAWGERTGPVWTKNRLRRALTCVSLPPSQRRAPFREIHKGGGAHVVLESRPKQRPSLLGLSARSALARDARAGCASRVRGQRPLPVCPTPASWEARPDRAQSSGVLRHSLGRADRAGLDKK